MIDKQVGTYIDKIQNFKYSDGLKEIKKYACLNRVPIIYNDVASLLVFLLKLKNPKRILEIGSAIGYSGALMLENSNAFLDTIEIDKINYSIAKENFTKLKFASRIRQYLGDASIVLPSILSNISKEGRYDFVFVDAAKGQYLDYFKYIEKIINQDAIIVFDNVLYKGIVAGLPHVRRNNTIEKRMNELIDYIMKGNMYASTLLSVGDGILLVSKS